MEKITFQLMQRMEDGSMRTIRFSGKLEKFDAYETEIRDISDEDAAVMLLAAELAINNTNLRCHITSQEQA